MESTTGHKLARTLRAVNPAKISFDPENQSHRDAVKDQVLGYGGTQSKLRFHESIQEIRQILLVHMYGEEGNEKNYSTWITSPGVEARIAFSRGVATSP